MARFIVDNCIFFALVSELMAGVLIRFYANEDNQPGIYLLILLLSLLLIHLAGLQLRKRIVSQNGEIGRLELSITAISFVLTAWVSVIPK